jgi:hypothetical protein
MSLGSLQTYTTLHPWLPTGPWDEIQRHVRVHEAGRRERIEHGLLAIGEESLQERQTLVWVEAAEWVIDGVRWVHPSHHRGDRECDHPRRAALEQAGDDDVVGTGREGKRCSRTTAPLTNISGSQKPL